MMSRAYCKYYDGTQYAFLRYSTLCDKVVIVRIVPLPTVMVVP
jgi:hypothetical protein